MTSSGKYCVPLTVVTPPSSHVTSPALSLLPQVIPSQQTTAPRPSLRLCLWALQVRQELTESLGALAVLRQQTEGFVCQPKVRKGLEMGESTGELQVKASGILQSLWERQQYQNLIFVSLLHR